MSQVRLFFQCIYLSLVRLGAYFSYGHLLSAPMFYCRPWGCLNRLKQ